MKVRIQKNSIRFRLKEPEVNHFQQTGKVSEVLEFGTDAENKLTFTLQAFDEHNLAVQYKGNTTTIFVPSTLADQWTTTDLVGFDGRIDTGKGRTISILVEKDFVCMDGREEDNVGSYPNPLMK
jgi:hypothetical protein